MSNYDKFIKHLDASTSATFVIAMHLHKKGYEVIIKPMQKMGRGDNPRDFADDGDLYIVTKDGRQIRVETKGLSAEFTKKEDWPFGKNFMVCAKHSYDNAKIKPEVYYYLNKAMTHMAVLGVSKTKDQWITKTSGDKRYSGNYSQSFYYGPIDKVEWVELVK